MNQPSFIEFLLKAKKATYAGSGPEMRSSQPNSHVLKYCDNDLTYIDSYIGRHKFTGEEAVWCDEKPFWAMNYAGRVLAEGFDSDFLKKALSSGTADQPFRGTDGFSIEERTYRCAVEGDFDWFQGYEQIYFGDTKVYECVFHGGAVE